MGKKNKEKERRTDRKKTISCGTVTWRVSDNNELPEKRLLEILLIQQFAHKDTWGIPKGHTNEGESLEDCAIRETKEETGLDVALSKRIMDVRIVLKKEDKTIVTFLAEPKNSTAALSTDDPDSEVADVRWFNANKLPKIVSYQQSLIENALARIGCLLLGVDIDVSVEQNRKKRAKEALLEVFKYARNVDDWIVVKKELLKTLSSDDRTVFSTRDPVTKKQSMNEFECELGALWSGMTGRALVFK
jgi:8-oxo-dGTP pyrophosphatase MutT (NUDIX family)